MEEVATIVMVVGTAVVMATVIEVAVAVRAEITGEGTEVVDGVEDIMTAAVSQIATMA